MDVSFDAEKGIIRCQTGGFQSVEHVQEFAESVARLADRERQERGHAKFLIMAESLSVQGSAVAEMGRKFSTKATQDDRIAVVVASALTKLQMARILPTGTSRCFLSEDAALAWLIEQPARNAVDSDAHV